MSSATPSWRCGWPISICRAEDERVAKATAAPKGRPVARQAVEAPRRVRQLITPEGVDLRLELADVSERAGAFLIDVAIMVASLILFSLLAGYVFTASGFKSGEPILVIWVLVYF